MKKKKAQLDRNYQASMHPYRRPNRSEVQRVHRMADMAPGAKEAIMVWLTRDLSVKAVLDITATIASWELEPTDPVAREKAYWDLFLGGSVSED